MSSMKRMGICSEAANSTSGQISCSFWWRMRTVLSLMEGKPSSLGAANSGEDGRDVAVGDGAITVGVEGVEADVEAAQAGFEQSLAEFGQAGAVGRELDGFDAGRVDKLADEPGDVAAQEGLAAGDAEMFEAARDGDLGRWRGFPRR